MHDLVIRGGRVVDGTGAPARTADVAIDGDRIVEVGRVDGAGRQEIDADGALVAPGWVDIHTHYDGQATWDAELAPSAGTASPPRSWATAASASRRCGPATEDFLIEVMEAVEDIPGTALHEGIDWQWETFGRVPRRARHACRAPSTSAPRCPTPPCGPTCSASGPTRTT